MIATSFIQTALSVFSQAGSAFFMGAVIEEQAGVYISLGVYTLSIRRDI